MVFSSLIFLFSFLPIVLIVYFFSKFFGKISIQNFVLVIASLIFYAWGEPVWVILLLFSAFVDFTVSKIMSRYDDKKTRKKLLLISLFINLGLLAMFKYSGFFVSSINSVTGLSIPVPAFTLPIGISFYTFQTLSYTIDVYRGDVKYQKSFLNFLMYVSLFPQLIAGPIVRYSDIQDQVSNRKITLSGFGSGITRFIVGLGKKVLIANTAGSLVKTFLDADLSSASVLSIWMGVIFFAFQIYFDFSGYSDMAIGLGRMFGFKYMENFNYPYLCVSITDFWRRWHISLSTFFRDYVYIPLGGNRGGIIKQIRNLLIVWSLTGLWHGASWNFVLWGLYYFVFLCLEKFLLSKFMDKIPSAIRRIYSLLVVLIGWVFFYFDDMGKLVQAFSVMFGASGNPFVGAVDGLIIRNNILFLILCILACLPIAVFYKKAIRSASLSRGQSIAVMSAPAVYNIIILFACTVSLAASTYNPFLYFRF